MTIHRARLDSGFVQIPNDTVRDPRLSYAARGWLAEHLSRPDNWQTSATATWRRARAERGKAGERRQEIRDIFTQLAANGYAHRQLSSAGRGSLASELHVFDQAQELDAAGTPIYFRLLAEMKGTGRTDVSAGDIAGGTSGARYDQGKHASSQVVSCDQFTDADISCADNQPTKNKESKNTDPKNTDRDDEQTPAVLTSPVHVEGSGDGEVKPESFDPTTREGTDAERRRQAALLEFGHAAALAEFGQRRGSVTLTNSLAKPPPPPRLAKPPPRPRRDCHVCGKNVAVYPDGRLATHGGHAKPCDGCLPVAS